MTRRPAVILALFLCALSSRATLATDEPDELLAGKVVIIKPGALFKFVAKPASGGTFALPGAGNDPRVEGANLRVLDTGLPSGGDDTYLLPAQTAPLGWKGLGSPAGAKGYKYKGAGSPADPCKAVLVKPSVIKAVCKDTGVGLTPPFGGNVAVVLTLGTDSKRYCATFGGEDVKNVSGLLKRTGAPATACGISLCGNGMVNSGEQCDDGNTMPGDGCDANCLPEESTSQPVSGGGTVTSDSEADGASPADPLETSVTSPAAGTVTIAETSPAGAPPAGFELRGQAAVITAPNASPTTPLSIAFTIDATQVRPGENETTVQVFRDGAQVSTCVGQPGEAYPEPCVFERTLVGGGDVQVSVRSAHASTWVFGFPLCGNGALNASEACDPPGVMGQCAAGQLCKSDCTCSTACNCCAASPTTFTVSHVPVFGTCGSAINQDGTLFKNLFCGVVYLGGGNYNYSLVALPEVTSVLGVIPSSCDAITETFALGPTTAAQTGSENTCTAAGCRFGPPVAVPFPLSSQYSVCLVLKRPLDASGTGSCGGVASIAFPIEADIHLTGDTTTDPSGTIPGIQPCPLCQGGSCVGGPNNGMSCTAQTSVPNASYPTSSDCPPGPASLFSSVPVGATVTSGVATAEAKASGGQARVFCGYCRDGDGDLSFANPPVECDSDAECGGVYEACQQGTDGAFGPGGSNVKTITLTGTVPGCLADMMPHPGTMVGGFCLEPTFVSILDSTADLPGPGATGLEGSIQLQ